MGRDQSRIEVQCLRLVGETAFGDGEVGIEPESNPGQIEPLRILNEPI